jgi:hypothetical protein
MALWSLGTVPIIVSAEDHKPETRLSEHIVLDGTQSIIHRFGYGSGVLALTAYILGDDGQYTTLEGYYHNQTLVALTSDQGAQGNFRVWSLTRKRVLDTRRNKPVYQLSIELKKN